MKPLLSEKIQDLLTNNPNATTIVLGKMQYREISEHQNCMERSSRKLYGKDIKIVLKQSHLSVE